jgi:UDP-glucose 6-dehydrogenase
VVIGADTVYSRQVLLSLYNSRLGRRAAYVVTDSVTAEFIKYAANCFLATKITYAQEIRKAARRIGAHYDDVVRAVGMDPRIGPGDEWFLDASTMSVSRKTWRRSSLSCAVGAPMGGCWRPFVN